MLNKSLRFVACAMLLSNTALAGVQEIIELDKVPTEIMQKIKEHLPKATLKSANTETEEDGTVVYEVQGELEDARAFEIDVFSDGKIEEIEVVFPESMVPKAVLNAIEKKLPGFKPTFIEASHSPSMKVMGYEFEGMLGEQKLDIDVSASGHRIEIADQ